jgi:hypothetical protein
MTILQRKSYQPPRLTLLKFQTKFIMFYFFNLLKKTVLEQQSIYFLLVKSNQYEAIRKKKTKKFLRLRPVSVLLILQMESINGLISSFRFMLEDEIAFALTQATPISQHILAKVNKHFHLSELSEINLTIWLFQVTQNIQYCTLCEWARSCIVHFSSGGGSHRGIEGQARLRPPTRPPPLRLRSRKESGNLSPNVQSAFTAR